VTKINAAQARVIEVQRKEVRAELETTTGALKAEAACGQALDDIRKRLDDKK
jgi:hypothetical protein